MLQLVDKSVPLLNFCFAVSVVATPAVPAVGFRAVMMTVIATGKDGLHGEDDQDDASTRLPLSASRS
jgi:hypothetical protein